MSKIESLLILVKSLSKAEKRYFRLQSNLQTGDKSYLYLYELLDSDLGIEEIQALFSREQAGKSLEMATKHLYKTIMDSLLKLRSKQAIETKIFNYISKADILFERELFDDAFMELDKAKRLAIIYEKDFLQLCVRRTELRYLRTLGFPGVTEKELVNKQMKINEVMKYSRNANLHLQLYDILKHRLAYKGYARSDKQKEDLNDLVLRELHLISNTSYKGFEVKKLHMLFQAAYFLNSGNYKSALRYYRELIGLFEINRHLILNPPVYYFSAIQGILDSLLAEGLYQEVPFFIRKLEEIEKGDYSVEYKLHVKAHIFLYEFNSLIHTGQFQEAGALIDVCKENLFQRMGLVGLEVQLKLHISLVTYYLYQGNIQPARKSMRKILGSGKSFQHLPSYRVARLINLLLQAEVRNYDLVYSEINSIRRSMRSEKQVYSTEKLVFRFLQFYPLPAYGADRMTLWKQLQKEIDMIRISKYEKQLLKTFDFISWIESKLTRLPLQEILAGKNLFPL